MFILDYWLKQDDNSNLTESGFVITEPKLYVVVHRLKRLLLALFNRKLLSQWKIDWKITFLSSHSLLCEEEMLKVAHGLLGKENDHLLVYWCCVIVVKKEIFVLLIKSNANECHTHAPSQLKVLLRRGNR